MIQPSSSTPLGGNTPSARHVPRLSRPWASHERLRVVDAEVLQELLHVYGGRRERENGVAVIGAILTLFPEPLPIGGMDLRLASQLFAAQPRLWARYALDAAVRCAMVPRPS